MWLTAVRCGSFVGVLVWYRAFGFGVSWVYVSLQLWPDAPPCHLGRCHFCLMMSGYIAGTVGYSLFVVSMGQCETALIMPACWILGEWLRGWYLRVSVALSGYGLIDTRWRPGACGGVLAVVPPARWVPRS
ncbi:MAG: hypothetical protein CM1200mP18_16170 [Gammaproteobacteria bacterium]|nr:MAG: hypothetical protein CM1200mP18_16170 [Gammaproteobacteria bacterium]